MIIIFANILQLRESHEICNLVHHFCSCFIGNILLILSINIMPFFEEVKLMIAWVTFSLQESKLYSGGGLSNHSVGMADISLICFINAVLNKHRKELNALHKSTESSTLEKYLLLA